MSESTLIRVTSSLVIPDGKNDGNILWMLSVKDDKVNEGVNGLFNLLRPKQVGIGRSNRAHCYD